MASTLEAVIDGQRLTVDLNEVTGWDALVYRATCGADIEALLLALTTEGAAFTAVEQSLVVWLWFRQNGQPDLPVRDAARLVRVLPEGDTGPDAPSAADALGETLAGLDKAALLALAERYAIPVDPKAKAKKIRARIARHVTSADAAVRPGLTPDRSPDGAAGGGLGDEDAARFDAARSARAAARGGGAG